MGQRQGCPGLAKERCVGESSPHSQAALKPIPYNPGTSPAPGIFTKALHIFPYVWLHERIGLLPSTTAAAGSPGQGSASGMGGIDWQWWLLNAAALLVADCGFYWWVRT